MEHLWDHLGRQVREHHDVNNIRDLERALQAEWVRIPLQVITKMIFSIRRRCLAVLASNGGHTRYWAVSEFYTRPPQFISSTPKTTPQNYGITLMRVIGDKNQISEDIFYLIISYIPFPEKSIRPELAKLFSISIVELYVTANSVDIVNHTFTPVYVFE